MLMTWICWIIDGVIDFWCYFWKQCNSSEIETVKQTRPKRREKKTAKKRILFVLFGAVVRRFCGFTLTSVHICVWGRKSVETTNSIHFAQSIQKYLLSLISTVPKCSNLFEPSTRSLCRSLSDYCVRARSITYRVSLDSGLGAHCILR